MKIESGVNLTEHCVSIHSCTKQLFSFSKRNRIVTSNLSVLFFRKVATVEMSLGVR